MTKPGRSRWFPTQTPHRSVLAQLTHTAPHFKHSLRDGTPSGRRSPAGADNAPADDTSAPRRLRRRVAPAEPFPPEPDHTPPESVQRSRVARDPVVREVASQLLTQGRVLLRHRGVSILAAPVRDGRQSPPEPALGRLTLHHPVTLARAAPVVRESQQVKSPCGSPRPGSPIVRGDLMAARTAPVASFPDGASSRTSRSAGAAPPSPAARPLHR